MQFECDENKRQKTLEERGLDLRDVRRLFDGGPLYGYPGPKRGVYLRLDPDVLDWFKATGKGYQTRINKALRAFVESRKRRAG